MKLTPREREVMHLVAIKCLSNQQIAARFKISKRTVELHRHRVMYKMGARNTAHLVHLVLGKCPHKSHAL